MRSLATSTFGGRPTRSHGILASALGLSPHPRVRSRIPQTEPEPRDDIINELLVSCAVNPLLKS